MEHLNEKQILERLIQATAGEQPKFQEVVFTAIDEKEKYETRKKAKKPKKSKKETDSDNEEEDRSVGYLELLAMMAKAVETEEGVSKKKVGEGLDLDVAGNGEGIAGEVSTEPEAEVEHFDFVAAEEVVELEDPINAEMDPEEPKDADAPQA